MDVHHSHETLANLVPPTQFKDLLVEGLIALKVAIGKKLLAKLVV